MTPRSTFVKLFLDNLLVMVVILALVGIFTYRHLDANYQAEARANQNRLLQAATEQFRELWPTQTQRIDRLCKTLFPEPALRLTVIAADGTVLGDSDADPATMVNHRTPDRPEVLAALDGHQGENTRTSETLGVRYRYLALPLVHEGQVVAAVRLAMPVKTIAEGETTLRNAILWAAATGTVAAVLLGFLASWIWYSPLRRITQAAKRIASGDLSQRASLDGRGRLSDLSSALNEMRDNLGKYLGQIAAQHQDFQAVLVNLHEGVVATDADGRVVLMNRSAGELLGVEASHSTGKHLQSVLPILEILSFYDQAATSGAPEGGQFEIETHRGRRTIEAHVTKVPPGASNICHLLVVRDVTDVVNASAMKAQFVANASHELRTPLATIRAAVDSLAATDPSDRTELAKLTGMLDRHVARLEEMTRDLLDLHMIESAKVPLHLADATAGALARWVEAEFAPAAGEKGLHLAVEVPSPETAIRTDRKLLELILRNLLDNAVKFTPAGGRVDCRLEPADGGLRITVSDTGCGIPAKDLPHVFERFYQGDAARSGDSAARGTGLGLAIVKHAADRLGAKVELTSQLGQGSTVAVFLPGAMS
jgi:two-component system phosphate regulon sensor histidine kinase PhoR